MEIRPLSSTSFDNLMDCFFASFENYFVKMPNDRAYFKERWRLAKVDYDLSYGMFDGDLLVGFIIHAIDTRFGHRTAFNTGTGVLPTYRGKRIVKAIYKQALDDLKAQGITKSSLEVIKENIVAINAYKSIGFEIVKHYKCFNGDLLVPTTDFELQTKPMSEIAWDTLPNQQHYSWDNQKETVSIGDYEYFEVVHDGAAESFFIINRAKAYVPQMDCFRSSSMAWKRLFAAIQSVSSGIKINNVDEALPQKIKQLLNAGLKNTIDQYEMELIIDDLRV